LFRLALVLQNKGPYHLTVSPRALPATDWGDACLVQTEYSNVGAPHYLRVVLPINHPLRNTYKGGKVVISLGACSYRGAVTSAAIKRAQILESAELLEPHIKISSSDQTRHNPSEYYLRDVQERWQSGL
jgi:hypothetical protein